MFYMVHLTFMYSYLVISCGSWHHDKYKKQVATSNSNGNYHKLIAKVEGIKYKIQDIKRKLAYVKGEKTTSSKNNFNEYEKEINDLNHQLHVAERELQLSKGWYKS